MTFKQIRLVFDDGKCTFLNDKIHVTPTAPSQFDVDFWGKEGYKFMLEEEYLNGIAAEGWVLHTANYCVLGKQEAHYFLFVKE